MSRQASQLGASSLNSLVAFFLAGAMYLCYVDESGTPDVPGNTSHFVLAGVSLPIWNWRAADRDISALMRAYDLSDEELHTAWLLRPYIEQKRIPNFAALSRSDRRTAVEQARNAHLLQLQQRSGGRSAYNQARKNYSKTKAYIHLTHGERQALVEAVADTIGGWGFARLFAECIDKIYFNPNRANRTIQEQAFEQVISRYERYLRNISSNHQKYYGLIVHDNNQTVAIKHTNLMRHFHRQGTLWTNIAHIIETPMFVDSALTSMVQAADLCAYALRRFVENQETNLFNRIFPRADQFGGYTVGVRHFSRQMCTCQICASHS